MAPLPRKTDAKTTNVPLPPPSRPVDLAVARRIREEIEDLLRWRRNHPFDRGEVACRADQVDVDRHRDDGWRRRGGGRQRRGQQMEGDVLSCDRLWRTIGGHPAATEDSGDGRRRPGASEGHVPIELMGDQIAQHIGERARDSDAGGMAGHGARHPDHQNKNG